MNIHFRNLRKPHIPRLINVGTQRPSMITPSSHGPSSWSKSLAHGSLVSFERAVKVAFNMLAPFNLCLTGLSVMAAVYLWKYRKEIYLLQLRLKDQEAVVRIYQNENERLYRQVAEHNSALRIIKRDLKPVDAVYGFVALERLEERTSYQIRYVTMALENVPKYYSSHAKLQRELERLQALDVKIEEVKRSYSWEFGLSGQHTAYKRQKLAVASQLLRETPYDQCPLEEFLHISPIESTFWNNGSQSQKRKLQKEFIKLKNIFPDISETKLQTAMVYVYSHFKRDIFALNPRRLERMVRKLIMEDEELENSGNHEEEAELCSICLEEMYDNEIIALVCNHLFHPMCINPWLERDHRCPLCRYPHPRDT